MSLAFDHELAFLFLLLKYKKNLELTYKLPIIAGALRLFGTHTIAITYARARA
jgi:hypothetical protein